MNIDVATYRSFLFLFIRNVFVTGDNFSFPEINRVFKSKWFKFLSWLNYSPS